MELIYDIDINVKGEAIRLVFKLAKLYSAECVKNRLVNLFLELISTHNEELTKKVSFLLGEILTQLEGAFNKSTGFLTGAIKSFKEYAQHKSDEIRKNFASSLVPVMEAIEPRTFLDSFKGILFNLLINDKNKEIRLISIGHLPMILAKVGVESAHKEFKQILIKLLKEEDKEILKKVCEIQQSVIQSLIPEPGLFLEDIINLSNETFSDMLNEFISLASKLHEKSLWRPLFALLSSLNKFLPSFPVQIQNEKYSALLEFLMKNGNATIRKLACELIIRFHKHIFISKKRLDILKMVQNEFLKSKSCFRRQLYIDFCLISMSNFSRKFLSIYIIPDCLNLAYDRVPNVRRKVALVLSEIRGKIRINDKENLKLFSEILEYLRKDFDTDVNEAANCSLKSIRSKNYEDPDFVKDCELFDLEKQKEEDRLSLIELKKEQEDSKKKSLDDNEKGFSLRFDMKDHNTRQSKSVKKNFMIKNYKLGGSPKCTNNKSYNPPISFSKGVLPLEKETKFSIKARFFVKV